MYQEAFNICLLYALFYDNMYVNGTANASEIVDIYQSNKEALDQSILRYVKIAVTALAEYAQRQQQAQNQNYEHEQIAEEEETGDRSEKTQEKHQQGGVEGFFG
ncbi:hypothetical protein WR25_22904 [Diploscapter pachys]|uniref:Uncharacterized protein n=1 Tax=Diploscapter pachys TaxID=2018661 RepID=A0A2A2KU07_9BILA|nr:hypothetical protein WR25_22904 [Diploscapter pachys]